MPSPEVQSKMIADVELCFGGRLHNPNGIVWTVQMYKNLLVQMDDGSMDWTFQMDGGPMDRQCYINLDRSNGGRSNGPPMLCQFGPSKWMTVQWTAYVSSIWTVQMDGPLDRNLDRPKLRLLTIILDLPKIRL